MKGEVRCMWICVDENVPATTHKKMICVCVDEHVPPTKHIGFIQATVQVRCCICEETWIECKWVNICQCTPQKFDEWIPHFSWFQNAKLLAKKSLIVAFFGGEVKVSTFTTPGRLRKWTFAKKTYEKRTCTLVFHTPCEDRCFCPQTPPEKACKGVLSHTSKRVRYFLGRDGLMEDGSGGQIESETILLAEDLEPVSESFVWGNNFLPTFQPFRRPSAHCQHAYLGNIYRSMNGLDLW